MIDVNIFKAPIKLIPARAYRTYLGGSLIDKMHGKSCDDDHFPEEWISSCTRAINIGREDIIEGLSYALIDDKKVLLSELIDKYTGLMLGDSHYNEYGTSLAILAKLIDSKERLAIQFHPDNEQAKLLFNSPFGKTESWHILAVRETIEDNPHIYLGLRDGVSKDEFMHYFNVQDIDGMISSLNKIYVSPGETYFVEGGIPHAIGAGCMLAELQEPTDFTLRTERVTPSGLSFADETMHLGLGFDKMFDCFNFSTFTHEQVLDKWRIQPQTLHNDSSYNHQILLGQDTTTRFGIQKIDVLKKASLPKNDSFYIIKCINGTGKMSCLDKEYTVLSGSEFFIPANAKDIKLSGKINILIFTPPFMG